MGRLLLDTSRVSYEVSVNQVPKLDQNGQQKFDRETKHPMWTVHLYALSENSGEVINVTVVSPTMPPVTVRQPVVPVDLEAPAAGSGRVRSSASARTTSTLPGPSCT
ncbi:hypothetical protein ACGFIG_15845 [Micromonospora sp. NPDC049048]|uniref:hypothetical protein n=1 Tax=Micromonospora sp. NPDC049048 TaxID=3364263 RepID=UPI0037117EF7